MPEDFSVSDIEPQIQAMLGDSEAGLIQEQQENAPVLVSHVTALYREHLKAKYPSHRVMFANPVRTLTANC